MVQYRNSGGISRRITIGRFGIVTTEEARTLAKRALADVIKGGDPAAKRLENRRAINVRNLCDAYLAAAEKGVILGKGGRPKRASTLYVDRGRIKHHILPLLGNLAKALSGRLRRLAPLLHAKGVNAEKLARTSAKRGWRLAPISAEEGKADLPSSPSSGSTATAACTDVPGAVIRNQQPVKENDDRDVSDDQFAGFSDRQHAMPVLSDIEAAYEEPRIRGDTVGPPVRRFRERKRTPLRPR
jgi:hypothetical protein